MGKHRLREHSGYPAWVEAAFLEDFLKEETTHLGREGHSERKPGHRMMRLSAPPGPGRGCRRWMTRGEPEP